MSERAPDLNPIEQVFAKFKTSLGKVRARAYETVSDACGEILTQYSPKECAAYIRECRICVDPKAGCSRRLSRLDLHLIIRAMLLSVLA